MNFEDIINLFRQGKATAKSHIKNLIEIAAVDGKFANDEQKLLEAIAVRNNIPQKVLKAIQVNPSKVVFEVPQNEGKKFQQLYDLVHMMVIDKNIHAEELRLCELFAIKFGYKNDVVKEVIETIRLNIENNNGPDETMKRISPYIKL
jgi:uncharacterized tellurite resistance protein B-like protein